MIPNTIHFIFGLKEDFGGTGFSYIHYLAIKSSYEYNHPDAIKFYYKYEPQGEWWEKSKPYLTMIKVEPPKEIFGNPLLHFAHQADVLRLEILIKEGGIYLDMDVITLNSYSPLRKYNCVMGMQRDLGLCNAVLLAEPNSAFLRKWYDEYRTFRSRGKDEFWDEHSVLLPLKLAKENPDMIHIEDKFSFFWPDFYYGSNILWDRPALNLMDQLIMKLKKAFSLKFLSTSYCIHLWESVWWDKYLKQIGPVYIQKTDDNFSKLCRKFLSGDNNKSKNIAFLPFRPIMKEIIRCYLKPST